MKLWYDVSDIIHWDLCHVTGIQRTVIGILGGLVEAGVDVRLVSLEPKIGRFCEVSYADLPSVVREHLPAAARGSSGGAMRRASSGTSRRDSAWRRGRRRVGDALLGTGSETVALRLAMRDFEVAFKKLRKGITRWMKQRVRGPAMAAHSVAT